MTGFTRHGEERSDEAADAVLGAVLGDTHQGADDATDGGGNFHKKSIRHKNT